MINNHKSYHEIVETCTLVDYTEEYVRTEYWTDGIKDYQCIWLPNNFRTLPSTYTYTII